MKMQRPHQSETIVRPASVHLSNERAVAIQRAIEFNADLVMRIKKADQEHKPPLTFEEMIKWLRSMDQQ